jgi:hypothetical protein
MIADRTLPKVEIDFLRPLLAGIAPDEAKPPVVSNPDNGWIALRDILEAELRARGAVLMQQVRTVYSVYAKWLSSPRALIDGRVVCPALRRWWWPARCDRLAMCWGAAKRVSGQRGRF